uniref:Uncharacterized protein n=1 Tax=Meloidogyne enterolobii TaxID=390850 RepID=A0A6V7U3Y8_MELEN|nr:unnamed protein product [Meloidogyne enterolobii]
MQISAFQILPQVDYYLLLEGNELILSRVLRTMWLQMELQQDLIKNFKNIFI